MERWNAILTKKTKIVAWEKETLRRGLESLLDLARNRLDDKFGSIQDEFTNLKEEIAKNQVNLKKISDKWSNKANAESKVLSFHKKGKWIAGIVCAVGIIGVVAGICIAGIPAVAAAFGANVVSVVNGVTMVNGATVTVANGIATIGGVSAPIVNGVATIGGVTVSVIKGVVAVTGASVFQAATWYAAGTVTSIVCGAIGFLGGMSHLAFRHYENQANEIINISKEIKSMKGDASRCKQVQHQFEMFVDQVSYLNLHYSNLTINGDCKKDNSVDTTYVDAFIATGKQNLGLCVRGLQSLRDVCEKTVLVLEKYQRQL